MSEYTTMDLINALGSGNKSDAQNVFNSVMSDKMNAALDDRRTNIAQSYGQQEQEFNEVEDDLDVDVQSVSDEDAEGSI